MSLKKNIIRNNAKDLRNNLNVSESSKSICEHILSWELYRKARNVMIFSPIGSEFSLMSLLNDKNKSFLFPIVDGENIYPVFYDETKGFKSGCFNIKEPVGSILSDYNLIDLIFIPALAVDKDGYRLGYGKGYYDRLLPHLSDKSVKAVAISSKLVFDKIPYESHDRRFDYLITEKAVIETSFKSNSLTSNY